MENWKQVLANNSTIVRAGIVLIKQTVGLYNKKYCFLRVLTSSVIATTVIFLLSSALLLPKQQEHVFFPSKSRFLLQQIQYKLFQNELNSLSLQVNTHPCSSQFLQIKRTSSSAIFGLSAVALQFERQRFSRVLQLFFSNALLYNCQINRGC